MSSTDIAEHWAKGDVWADILAGMEKAGLSPDTITVEDLAPLDHFHARGFPATVDLADALTVRPTDHLVDIGCGVGGPARYIAKRFGCRVSGIDITPQFVEIAGKLTELVGLSDRVRVVQGDGQHLPFGDAAFDGGYSQHVTMNIPDRAQFFGEAFRVLKPGAFFALTEHGAGPNGPSYFPVPWSDDGSGAFLIAPEETEAALGQAGFVDIKVKETGPDYLAGYLKAIEIAEAGKLPPFGMHILVGKLAAEKTRNAARNIQEGRTRPIQVMCRKPE